ncbi:MAG: type II secretion system protein, partial [Candidatus Omnitrophota bacterium]|nr:type II secretion system protein [Candidatus Omnitrophota bacterium]
MKLTGFTLVEFLVVICIAFILIGSFAIYANIILGTAREIALQNELMNMRLAIEHYRIINAKYPTELSDLVTVQRSEVNQGVIPAPV